MAVKHRKLFPALTATNQTTDCPEFCDSCPDNCYPYGDYYFLPPPPPPPLSPTSTFLSQQQHISPYVFVIVSLVAAFFLVVSYYVIVAKSFPSWCCCRTNRQLNHGLENNPDEEFLDENRVDHPIWFITTIGLQQSVINSITICRYKKGEGLIEGTECSVCLSEFQQDEALRLLPKCNHAFHISCIDTWLRSHINCPLCRAHIVNDVVSVPLVSANQNPGIPTTIGNTRRENSGSRNDLGNNQERNEALHENRVVLEEEGDIVHVVGDQRIVKEDQANSDDNINHQLLSDSGGRCETIKNIAHPIKRSFSVDSVTSATKSPIPMKRSLSCAGRFLSSRQNKSLNSVIPL